MESKSNFNSPELQKAFEHIEPILTQHKTQLDQVSSDIKEVERFIRGCGVHFPLRFLCRERSKVIDEDPFHHQKKEMLYRDYLCWDKSKDGQFRLLYEVEEQLSIVDNGTSGVEPMQVIKRRPLIEAKVKVRLELYPELPRFLEAMASELQLLKTEQTRADIAESIKTFNHKP